MRWFSPSVTGLLIQGFLAAINLALGLFQLFLHNYLTALFSFTAAGFILAIAVAAQRRFRMQQTVALGSQAMLTPDEEKAAFERATANCRMVAEKVGATISGDYCSAWIDIGSYRYLIWCSRILRRGIPGASSLTTLVVAETCLMMGPARCPLPEQIASVLLLLKNDPTIFDRWCKHDGLHA